MIKESKQKRALLAIIAVLFLANVATMAILLSQKPGQKKEKRSSRNYMSAYLQKELNFTPVQMVSFDSLHSKHMVAVEAMVGDMKQEKQNRFKYLADQHFNDSVIAAAAATMSDKQEILEIKMLKHLRDVRDLGDARQKAKFDTTFLPFIIREKEKKKKMKY